MMKKEQARKFAIFTTCLDSATGTHACGYYSIPGGQCAYCDKRSPIDPPKDEKEQQDGND